MGAQRKPDFLRNASFVSRGGFHQRFLQELVDTDIDMPRGIEIPFSGHGSPPFNGQKKWDHDGVVAGPMA
jgi:hypothetical protein